jgi:prefoldin alpha subunit
MNPKMKGDYVTKENQRNVQEELQKILLELENSRRQIDAINKQMEVLELTLSELNSTQEVSNYLKENKPGKEILVPIGSGSYIKAKLKDTEKVLIGVGAGISIERSVEEAERILAERKKNLSKAIENLHNKTVELNNRISQLTPTAERLVQKLRGGR